MHACIRACMHVSVHRPNGVSCTCASPPQQAQPRMPLASQHTVPRRAAFGAQHEHASRWNDPPAAAGAYMHVWACARTLASAQHVACPRSVTQMRKTRASARPPRTHVGTTRKADAKSRFPTAARPAARDAAGRQVWAGEARGAGEKRRRETGKGGAGKGDGGGGEGQGLGWGWVFALRGSYDYVECLISRCVSTRRCHRFLTPPVYPGKC